MAAKFRVFVYKDQSKLPTLFWLPKLHKRPYKSRFIAYSSLRTTTELSIVLTSCLTTIKTMSFNIAQQFMKQIVKNYFVILKIPVIIFNKLECRGFQSSGLSTYDFSTLYTTLPLNLIKDKLTEFIEHTFNR